MINGMNAIAPNCIFVNSCEIGPYTPAKNNVTCGCLKKVLIICLQKYNFSSYFLSYSNVPLAPICFLTPKLKNAASIANCNGTNLVKTFFTYTEYTSGVKILFSFGTISCIPVMVIFVSNIKMHAK